MNSAPAPGRQAPESIAPLSGDSLLQRLRLRWLVCGITAVMMLCFMGVALFDHRVSVVALAGSLIVAGNGLTWLVLLRKSRRQLRRHGYRW